MVISVLRRLNTGCHRAIDKYGSFGCRRASGQVKVWLSAGFGTGSNGEGTRGWKTNHSSGSGGGPPVCIAERVQVQRNGTVAKEAALRWSALTRPVGRASGATVVRATLHELAAPTNLQLHTLRLPRTASHVPL